MQVGEMYYVKYNLDYEVMAGEVGIVVSISNNFVCLRVPIDGSFFSWTLDNKEKLEPVEPEKAAKILPAALELLKMQDDIRKKSRDFSRMSYKNPNSKE